MNASDVLKYGHLWVHKHLEGLSEDQMLVPNVCGVWSTKDIVAHLTSFEWLLAEILETCVQSEPTPLLDAFTSMDGDSFNAVEVGKRQNLSPAEVVEEYEQAYDRVAQALPRLSTTDLTKPGSIPWYGDEYALDDLIVYQYYGHKREHCAQIAVYRDTLKGA